MKRRNTMKQTNLKYLKEARGITLIALVITIIVLLILAAVSIATLTGENGILTRANDSKSQTEIGEEKEAIGLAYNGVMAENRDNGVNASDLQDELISNGYNATASGSNPITVKFNDSQRIYEIDANGNIIEAETGEVTPPTGSLPSTTDTTPFLPDGATPTNTKWDTGVTIKDSNNNEWVWIVVPKSEMPDGLTFENDEDYTTLETALQTYAQDYRQARYTDEWYEGCGLDQGKYITFKKNMLKSVYKNGGFYIGKYEVGSFDNPVTARDTTRKAVIQEGAFPYNWVSCSDAEGLSEELAIGGKTSSLMFGIQWDLVLKYLEVNGNWDTTSNIALYYLNTNSSSWGNYQDVSFDIVKGMYSDDEGANYSQVNEEKYNKPMSNVLFTTGVTERNSMLNIFDLAGNVREWTLEKDGDYNDVSVYRGGGGDVTGSAFPVVGHSTNIKSTSNSYNLGFRPTLF